MSNEHPQQLVVFCGAGWVGRAVLADLEGRHAVRAVDYGTEAWAAYEEVDGTWSGSDIADYDQVAAAVDGMDAVIHTAVLGGTGRGS